jgi:hypothetical protein
MIRKITPLFGLGQVVSTPGALEALTQSKENPSTFLDRHVTGDWSDCCKDDAQANEDALASGARIFSVYATAKGQKFWIITEAVADDGRRLSTCLLLPSEY